MKPANPTLETVPTGAARAGIATAIAAATGFAVAHGALWFQPVSFWMIMCLIVTALAAAAAAATPILIAYQRRKLVPANQVWKPGMVFETWANTPVTRNAYGMYDRETIRKYREIRSLPDGCWGPWCQCPEQDPYLRDDIMVRRCDARTIRDGAPDCGSKGRWERPLSGRRWRVTVGDETRVYCGERASERAHTFATERGGFLKEMRRDER